MQVNLINAIGQSEGRTAESIKLSEANLHVVIGLLRQVQTKISTEVKILADKHDELASSTDQRLTVIENVISSNPPPVLPAMSNHCVAPGQFSVRGLQPPPARPDPRRPVSPYDTVTAALERLPDSLRSNISSHFPNATARPTGTSDRATTFRANNSPAASDPPLLAMRRIGVSSEFNDCPVIPSSPRDIQEIESFLPIVRLSPVLATEVDHYLALNNNELWPALCELAVEFLRSNANVDENTLSSITIINAWIGSEPTMLTSLFVKFSTPAQARSLNPFKRNLLQGKRIDDVIPPCLMELENYLQGKAFAMRSVNPRVYDSRVVWAGRSRVLQRKIANSVGASFRIVCGNSQVRGGYVPPSIAAALQDTPADRPPYVVADHIHNNITEDESADEDDREAFNRETGGSTPADKELNEVDEAAGATSG